MRDVLNPLGEVIERVPVSLAAVRFPDIDDEAERREAAQKFAEARTIKAGATAWALINRAESFSGWLAIGRALQIGRDHAMKVTGANRPMGQIYCKEFSAWIDQHGIKKMAKSVRSVAIELAEHGDEITAWRDSLPERQKKRLVHPLSVTRRWKASTANSNGKYPADLKRDAAAAWRRFVACVGALPADQAAPLWRAALAELASMAMPKV